MQTPTTTTKARRGRGWIKWASLVVLAAAGVWGGWQWYAKRTQAAQPEYKTVQATRGDLVQTVTANGQINPLTNVVVGTQVSGIITAINADFNSRVTNGQVLAQIDPSSYQQSRTQNEAELASAKAGMELAEMNHRRAKELRAADLIPVADYEKAISDLHQAQAQVSVREAALKKTLVDLERTTIYSPIDGLVISRNVDAGQTVAASFNTPTLFQIVNDLRQMRIEALVSEADVGGVEEGQPVSFTVEAFQGRRFEGQVTQVRYAAMTNQNVVNYTTIVKVRNDDLKLRPGMTAIATIITAERKGALRIPNAALRFRPTEFSGLSKTNALAGTRSGVRRTNEGAPAGGRGRPGAGFGPGGGGGRDALRPPRSSAPNGLGAASDLGVRRIYCLSKSESSGAPVLRPVDIKTGISDGAYTEVLEGLREGDEVVTGLSQPQNLATQPRPGASPFGGPFGGGMRGPR